MQPVPGPPPHWPCPPAPGWPPPPMSAPMMAPPRPRGPSPAKLGLAIAAVVLLFAGLFGSCLLSVQANERELTERSAFVLKACGRDGHALGCASAVEGDAKNVQRAHEAIVHWEHQLGPFAEIVATNGLWLRTENGDGTGRILLDVRFGDTTKPVLFGYHQQGDEWMLVSFLVDPSAEDLRD